MTRTKTATDRHAELVGAGWSTRLDGRWRAPDYLADSRAFSADAAWSVHIEQTEHTTGTTEDSE